MTSHLDFATQLARDTGELLLSFFRTPKVNATRKADWSVLTEADLAADRLLTARIHEAYPNDQIISEEAAATYSGPQTATWIIDPLDGTSNFSVGFVHWGVSIARVENGRTTTAALFFPLLNELFTAERGQGAYRNGEAIHTVPYTGQPAAFFACGSGVYRDYDVRVRYKPRMFGSSAYNFCAVACGYAVYGLDTTPKVWDIAASWLVLEEAGGALASMQDALFPLKSGFNYHKRAFPTLGAANEEMLKVGREKIRLR